MLDWWDNYAGSLTGLALRINIMSPLLSAGFMDAALTEADGIHPTAFGYQDIGELIAAS
jgi:lysophospholipase L1-like esterase